MHGKSYPKHKYISYNFIFRYADNSIMMFDDRIGNIIKTSKLFFLWIQIFKSNIFLYFRCQKVKNGLTLFFNE